MEKLTLEEPVDNKATLSEKLKGGISSLFSIFKKKDNTIKFKTSEEGMGEIFKLMVEVENDRKLERAEEHTQLKDKDSRNEKRNQELIKALKGLAVPKRKPRPKKKVEEKKVEQVKKEEPSKPAETKPTETKKTEAKPAETKPAETKPAPKAEPVKPTEVKPEPKVEPVKPAEPARPRVRAISEPILPSVGKAAVAIGAATGALVGKEALAANIAKYESKASSGKSFGGNEYNAYNKGTSGNKIVPADKPIDFSKMTIEEYLRRGNLKSGDPDKIFAMGRYQIIPKTMESLVKKLQLDPKTTYLKPETQDLLFSQGLIEKTRKKVNDYITGKSDDRDAAILELAQEFASVGIPYDMKVGSKNLKRGESYYSGIGGNKAHNSPEEVGAALDSDRLKNLSNKTQPVPPTTGQKVDSVSKESQELNMKADMDANKAKTTINNIQTSVNAPPQKTPQQDKVDDRPAILKK